MGGYSLNVECISHLFYIPSISQQRHSCAGCLLCASYRDSIFNFGSGINLVTYSSKCSYPLSSIHLPWMYEITQVKMWQVERLKGEAQMATRITLIMTRATTEWRRQYLWCKLRAERVTLCGGWHSLVIVFAFEFPKLTGHANDSPRAKAEWYAKRCN